MIHSEHNAKGFAHGMIVMRGHEGENLRATAKLQGGFGC